MKPANRLHAKDVQRYLNDPCIKKLARIAESWGGGFKFMDADTIIKCVDRDARRAKHRLNQECYYSDPGLSLEGLVINTHWRRKVIYLSPECCPNPEKVVGSLIHEMGHVFADPKPPDDSDELEWLGWEIALARWVGCYSAWNTWKDGFGLGAMEHLPPNIAAFWQQYDDSVCRGACAVCCGHAERIAPLKDWAEWGDLNDKGKRSLTRDRIQHGIAIGIIDPGTKQPLPTARKLETTSQRSRPRVP